MKLKIIGIFIFLMLLWANPVHAQTSPTANAGTDINILETLGVPLDGTASFDPDPGDSLTFEWVQLLGIPVALFDSGTALPSFVAPPVGVGGAVLTFELTVTDSLGLTDTDLIEVTIRDSAGNSAPTGNIGPNQSVASGATVQLDASGYTDPDGDRIFFNWQQLSGPIIALSSPIIPNPTFTAPTVAAPTELTFEVIVSDGLLDTRPQVTITVNPAAPDDFAMELMVEEAKAKLNLKKSNRDKVEVEGEFWLNPDSDDIAIGTNAKGRRFIDEDVTVKFDGRPEFEETIPAGSLVEKRRKNHFKYRVKHPTGPVRELKIEYVPGSFHGEFEVKWKKRDLTAPPIPTVEDDLIASDPILPSPIPVPFDLDIGNDNGVEAGINFTLEKDRRHKRVYEFEKEDEDEDDDD